ncbi:MAG: hypothetical protein Q9172_006490 [Xanthocarpia lactea]
MGPPPAKRRRKLVVLTSSEEEEEEEEFLKQDRGEDQLRSKTRKPSFQDHVLPTRLRSKSKPVPKAPLTAPSQSTAQLLSKKPAANAHNLYRDPKTPSLETYFNAANNSHAVKTTGSQTSKLGTAVEEEDFIEDDSFDEEMQKLLNPRKDPKNRQKQAPAQSATLTEKTSSSKLLSGSQVFRNLGNGIAKSDKKEELKQLSKDDTRPWSDRYGPMSLEELAVHKKKVADVRDWLDKVFQGRSKKRVLILKGASGVGKTATVSTLSTAMNFDLLEWANPAVSDFHSDNYVSTTALFDEFLRRGGKFTSLDVTGSEDAGAPTNASSTDINGSKGKKRVILVEELPNMFMSSSAAVQSFRASILQYLSTTQTPPSTNPTDTIRDTPIPLVIILTESQTTHTTSLTDSLTAHRLLGPSILSHPNIDTIEFNPIAPTFITKALNLILQKEALQSGRRSVPGPSVLKRLSESGDVRSAIGSLEFLSLKGTDGDDWSGRVAAGKGKKGAKSASALTEKEEVSLELVTRREVSLGLFHAVGKVVYNKREGILSNSGGDSNINSKTAREEPTQPPDHLPQHVRLKAPDVAVEELIDETGTDPATFVAALHENYVPSCAGETFLDTLNACIDNLSDSDILFPSTGKGRYRNGGNSNNTNNNIFQNTGTDSLRQDEIAFHIAVRGILFSLPNPVKRSSSASAGMGGLKREKEGKSKADTSFKIFYPASLRLAKRIQDIQERVERCHNRLSSSPHHHHPATSRWEEGVVASWAAAGRSIFGANAVEEVEGRCIHPTRKEDIILEILPYRAIMERCRRPGSKFMVELDAVTKISRNYEATESPDDDSDFVGGGGKSGMQSKSYMLGEGEKKAGGSNLLSEGEKKTGESDILLVGKEEEEEEATAAGGRLFLSDDDIED